VFGNSSYVANQEANYHVSELSKWFIATKLSLNISMTCYMVFSFKSNDDIMLYYGRHSVMEVGGCQYLGVIIDKELNLTAHTEQLYGKLIKFTGILYKL
jgi:hypothetical protein